MFQNIVKEQISQTPPAPPLQPQLQWLPTDQRERQTEIETASNPVTSQLRPLVALRSAFVCVCGWVGEGGREKEEREVSKVWAWVGTRPGKPAKARQSQSQSVSPIECGKEGETETVGVGGRGWPPPSRPLK